jgi:hypothetical protein
MTKTYLNSLSLSKISSVAILAALSATATLAPFLKIQLITGTIVNACLILAVCLLPKKQALVVAFFPSLVAAAIGQLPAPLVPLIPLIVAANIAFMSVFAILKNKGYAVSALSASLAKFAFLSAAGIFSLNFLVAPGVGRVLAPIISYWQLVTALLGSAAAFLALKYLKPFKPNA